MEGHAWFSTQHKTNGWKYCIEGRQGAILKRPKGKVYIEEKYDALISSDFLGKSQKSRKSTVRYVIFVSVSIIVAAVVVGRAVGIVVVEWVGDVIEGRIRRDGRYQSLFMKVGHRYELFSMNVVGRSGCGGIKKRTGEVRARLGANHRRLRPIFDRIGTAEGVLCSLFRFSRLGEDRPSRRRFRIISCWAFLDGFGVGRQGIVTARWSVIAALLLFTGSNSNRQRDR